jgi:hypothetical protein
MRENWKLVLVYSLFPKKESQDILDRNLWLKVAEVFSIFNFAF